MRITYNGQTIQVPLERRLQTALAQRICSIKGIKQGKRK